MQNMHDQLFKVFSIVARMSQTKGKRCARLKFHAIKSWSIGTFSFLDNIVFLSDLGMTLWFRQSYLPFDRNFWRIFLTHLLFFGEKCDVKFVRRLNCSRITVMCIWLQSKKVDSIRILQDLQSHVLYYVYK